MLRLYHIEERAGGSSLTRTSGTIGVLVADSNDLQIQLLTAALRRRPEFRVSSCPLEMDAILHEIDDGPIDVVLLDTDQQEMSIVRDLRLAKPQVAKILLLQTADRDITLSAFRMGVRGIFCFSNSPFRLLCKCIQRVHRGEIWLSNGQLEYLIEALTQVPSLRVVNSGGLNLLTPREEQVVALAADGLSNRAIGRELGLTENTIKKYLFRIFEKIGVSSRVELVLYAVTRGASRQAEWIPA
jgi:DNA-binding NarL/FixJ family response regulator